MSRALSKLTRSWPVRAVGAGLSAVDRVFTTVGRWLELAVAWALKAWDRWGLPAARRTQSVTLRAAALVGRVLGPVLGRMAPHVPWSCTLGVLATSVVAAAATLWRVGDPLVLLTVCGLTPEQIALFKPAQIETLSRGILTLAAVLSFLGAAAALAAFVRARLSLLALKALAAGYVVLLLFVQFAAWRWVSALAATLPEQFLAPDRNEALVRSTLRLALPAVQAVVLLFVLVLRAVSNFYRREATTAPAAGDRIWQNLRSHGRDPGFRKALYVAICAHVFVLLVLPHLLMMGGCMRAYEIQKGMGEQTLEMIKIRKVKKKEIKKYVLNMNTAISFYVPKIDDSEVFEDVDKLTENLYEAQQEGKLGVGGKGPGGWPNGMEKARVRFIRLRYDGGDWDQDMGYGSDYNMLLKFRELTTFNVWHETESIRIADLLRFPRKRAPPFVYLTGGLKGRMAVSQGEVKALRKYCTELGGMIFADNGGGNFDPAFRELVRRVFPDLQLVEVAYDDVIFQRPYGFPKGAPPLWHHSGNRALGMKYQGRWVVFYHQGDVNDAWKTGHSGVSDAMANQAYKLGVNVMNYAFNQYMFLNYGDK